MSSVQKEPKSRPTYMSEILKGLNCIKKCHERSFKKIE